MKQEFETNSSGAAREKMSKLPYDLVPFQEMTEAYVRVAEFGAQKYLPWNWSKGLSKVQLCCSLLRHTFAYIRGEDRDPESGLVHTDHILWNAVALCHNVEWNLEDGRRAEPKREYYDKPIMPLNTGIIKDLKLDLDDIVTLQENTDIYKSQTKFSVIGFTDEGKVQLCDYHSRKYCGVWSDILFSKDT